jgi:pyruvate dehydrogenase (quinone)
MCSVWAARYLRAAKGRRFLGSLNHGSMANALSQAIGAQVTYPDRQVVALCGDGGLAMLMGELLTVAQYDLPVKILVFNNHSLGMVRLEMEVAGFPPYGCDLKNPNFASLAEAIGFKGVRIEDPAQVRPELKRAIESSGPVLIDVVTDPNVLARPRGLPWR